MSIVSVYLQPLQRQRNSGSKKESLSSIIQPYIYERIIFRLSHSNLDLPSLNRCFSVSEYTTNTDVTQCSQAWPDRCVCENARVRPRLTRHNAHCLKFLIVHSFFFFTYTVDFSDAPKPKWQSGCNAIKSNCTQDGKSKPVIKTRRT